MYNALRKYFPQLFLPPSDPEAEMSGSEVISTLAELLAEELREPENAIRLIEDKTDCYRPEAVLAYGLMLIQHRAMSMRQDNVAIALWGTLKWTPITTHTIATLLDCDIKVVKNIYELLNLE